MAGIPSNPRVVITGMGVVSPIGLTPDEFWSQLIAGKTGVDRITLFDPAEHDSKIAAEVREFDPQPAFPSPKEARRVDRYTQLAVLAGHGALQDAGLDLERVNHEEVGVFIGSGIGGLWTTERQHTILLEKGPQYSECLQQPYIVSL